MCMDYILIVFKSRTETLSFSELLKQNKISSAVVSTPKEVSHACGISVKCFSEYRNLVIELLRGRRYSTYTGMFKVSQIGVYKKVERID